MERGHTEREDKVRGDYRGREGREGDKRGDWSEGEGGREPERGRVVLVRAAAGKGRD